MKPVGHDSETGPRERFRFAVLSFLSAVFFLTAPLWSGDSSLWWGFPVGGVALALSTGALSLVMISAHDDDWDYSPVGAWHVGQLLMASLFMVLLGAVGTGGIIAAAFSLDPICRESTGRWCSSGQATLYIVGGIYALFTIVLWPGGAWWKWLSLREQRRRTLETARKGTPI